MKPAPLITIVAVSFLSAGTVTAESPPLTFEQLDANGDGYVSQKEARARKDLSDKWKSIDTNADGKINSEEFVAFESRNRFVPPDEMIDKGIGARPTPE